MRSSKTPFKIALCVTAVFSVALAVWRSIILKKYYDPYSQAFDRMAKVPNTVIIILFFAFAAALIAFAVIYRKTSILSHHPSSGFFPVGASALMGIAFVSSSLVAVIWYGKELFSDAGKQTTVFKISAAAAVVLGLICAVYFFLGAAQKANLAKARKYLSVALPLWGVAFAFMSYFDHDFIYSDINRHFANIAAIATLLLLLAETRSYTEYKPNTSGFASALAAIVACTVYTVPTLIFTAFGQMSATAITPFEMTEVAVVVYATSVAIQFIGATGEEQKAI